MNNWKLNQRIIFFFLFLTIFQLDRAADVEQNGQIFGFKYDLHGQIQVNSAFKLLLLLRTVQPEDDAIHDNKWKFCRGTEFIH